MSSLKGEYQEESMVTVDELEADPAMEAAMMSPIAKVMGIIWSPVKTMEAIKDKPNILVPMIIAPILPLLYYLIFWNQFIASTILQLEAQFEMMGQTLTQEMLDLQLTMMKFTAPIGTVVGIYLGSAFVAFIYWLVLKIVKSKVTYKQMFSVVIHASIISSLLFGVHMIATLIFGETNLAIPMTSLASLLPSALEGTFIYYLTMSIEVITIWQAVVIYYGIVNVGEVKEKKAAAICIIIFILSALLGAGLMMLQTSVLA